jgi:hypothetical protein
LSHQNDAAPCNSAFDPFLDKGGILMRNYVYCVPVIRTLNPIRTLFASNLQFQNLNKHQQKSQFIPAFFFKLRLNIGLTTFDAIGTK